MEEGLFNKCNLLNLIIREVEVMFPPCFAFASSRKQTKCVETRKTISPLNIYPSVTSHSVIAIENLKLKNFTPKTNTKCTYVQLVNM
jgi:hypothetical protein